MATEKESKKMDPFAKCQNQSTSSDADICWLLSSPQHRRRQQLRGGRTNAGDDAMPSPRRPIASNHHPCFPLDRELNPLKISYNYQVEKDDGGVCASLSSQKEEDDDEIDRTIEKLNKAKTIKGAKAAIKALYKLMGNDTTEKDTAEKLASSNYGVGALIRAIEKWHTRSSTFSKRAIGCLVQLTYFADSSMEFIVKTGGLETALAAAKKHSTKCMVRSHVLGLLINLANQEGTKRHVTSDECLTMVIDTMKRWPKDEFIQDGGSLYFYKLLQMKDMKPKLREKKIGSILAAVIDNFRTNDEVFGLAIAALEAYNL